MSTARPAKKPPTPAEVQAEQNRLLELDKQKATAPNVPAVVEAKLPALNDGRAFHDKYLDVIAPATIAGKMLKFTKNGEYEVPDDESKIGEDVQFIALVPEILIGWIKFNGSGNPPSREMGLLYDGYQMPPRESLGDTDEAAWEMGLDGKPGRPVGARDLSGAAARR